MPRIRGKQLYIDQLPIHPYDAVNKAYIDSIVFSGVTSTGITSLSTALSNEIITRTTNDTSLTTALSTEIRNTITGITSLETALSLIPSGSTNLTIQDEGIVVSSNVNTLNFIGDTVRAIQGVGRIDIFIPTPTYASHFNSQDGTTNATVTNFPTTSRYIAAPSAEGNPYYIGDWTAGTIHDTIRNSSILSYSTTNAFSILNSSTTTFNVTILDENNLPTTNINNIILSGNGIYINNNITIQISNWNIDANKYRANISISIDIANILLQGGRFGVQLTHNNGSDGTYTYNQNNIFRDSETLSSSLSTSILNVVSHNGFVITKYISGVQYFTLNTQWSVDINNIKYLNSRSYPVTQQLNIDENNLFISNDINVHGNNITYDQFSGGTWTNSHYSNNAAYQKLNWTTDQSNHSNWNHTTGTINNTYITALIYDWSQVSSITSQNYNYLIDTYMDSSDRNSEMFRSESFRLTSGLTTWNSNISLLTQDSGSGLQVISDRLIYPQYSFTTLEPSSSTQPNYTTLTGSKNYIRQFQTDGTTASNGIILLTDHNITENDLLNNDVIITLSLDSVNWISLNMMFDGVNVGSNTGCRIDDNLYNISLNNSIRFTLQGLFTTNIYFKITFTDTVNGKSKYIGGIDFTDAHWA